MLKGNQKTLGQSCSPFAMPLHDRPHMRALEPRILLDAAAVETAADAVSEAVHSGLADDYVQSNFPERSGESRVDEQPSPPDPLEVLDLQSSVEQRSEIVFVAADIDDPTKLLAGLSSSTEVVFLTADKDGLSQIAETLALRSEVDAIHILSHGSQGSLSLGGPELTTDSMRGIYAAQLAMIGDALSESGDILIYGCDFAGGDIGRKAVEAISRITGADVAASEDLTGNAAQGGDWDLEVKSGDIEAHEVAVRSNWAGTLADVVLEEYSPDLSEIQDEEEIGSTRSVGQTFQHDSGNGTYEVDKVEVVLRDVGGPSQTIRVTITETFGGTILGEGTFNSASITNSFDYYAIPLDAATTLNDGTEYFITLSTDNSSETIETANSQDGNYTDGRYVNPDGTYKNNHDLYFKIIDSENSDPIIERSFLEGVAGFRFVIRDENSTAVGTVVANDADVTDTLTFSILSATEVQTLYPSLAATSSDDFGLFTIDPNTGELFFAAGPNFEIPTDTGENNTYWVTVQVSDGNGGTDALPIGVSVRDINDAPMAQDNTLDTDEDTSLNLSAAFFFIDEDGDAPQSLTIQALDLGGGTLTHSGGVTVNAGQTYTTEPSTFEFTPALNSTDPVTIQYTINDDDLGTQVGTITININSLNDAPTITSHSGDDIVPLSFDENQTFVSSVTAFDVDLPGDTITYSITGGPDAASFVIDPNTGDLSFIDAPDFENPMDFNTNGIFRVIVTASDGNGGTDTQQFTITLADVNEAPVATASTVVTNEDTPHTFAVSDFNYDDEDGDAVTSVTVSNLALAGGSLTHSGGTVVNNGDTLTAAQIDTLIFTPAPNSAVDATFDFIVNDSEPGIVAAQMTVQVDAVNDTPVATNASITIDEDTSRVLDGNITFTDVEGDPLQSVTIQDLRLAGGTLVYGAGINVNVGDTLSATDLATLTFTPSLHSVFAAEIDFTANDADLGTDIGTLTISITPVNDAPVASDSSVTTNEDVAHSFSVADFGYTDVESDALASVTLTNLSLAGGTLSHSGGTIVNNGDTLTASEIDTLIYTPAANSSVDAAFDYTVNDVDAGTVSATMTVQVDAVNDLPVATASSVTTNEDTAYVFSAADFGYTDVEGDALVSITLSNISLAGGTLTHSGGAVSVVNGDTITAAQLADLTFTPAANSSANASFDYTVNDADAGAVSATMTIQVDAVNDLPVATDSSVATNEDVAHSFSITDFGYTDVESDALASVTLTNLSLAGGTLSHSGGTIVNNGDTLTAAEIDTLIYTPAANSSVDAAFDYTVNDVDAGTVSATMTVQVDAVNDLPVATASSVTTNEDTAYVFSAADFGYTDVEGDALVSITLSNISLAGGTLTHSGGAVSVVNGDTITAAQLADLTFTPAANSSANASFDYTVNDADAGAVSATMTIQVDAVNDLPVATDSSVATNEDVAHSFSITDFGYTDVESDALASVTLTNLSLAGGTLSHSGGTIVNNGDTLTASEIDTLIYTPAANSSVDAAFDYTVNDVDAGTVSATMTVQVDAVNDLPVATASSVTTNEDTAYVFSAADFGYTDVEGDALVSITLSNISLAGGTLTHSGGAVSVVNGDTITAAQLADLTFTPAANSSANASFDYTVNDADAGAVSATMTIQVDAVNDAPTLLTSGAGTTWQIDINEGEVDVVDIDAVDIDVPSDTLTYSIVDGNDFDKFDIDPATGALTFIQAPDFENPHDLTSDNDYHVRVQVSDGNGGVDTQNIRVVVQDVNELPVATGGSTNAMEDIPHAIPLSAFNFTDPEGDGLQSITVSNLDLSGGSLTHSGGSVLVTNGMTISVADLADLTFVSATNDFGNVSFDYSVNDDDTGLASATLNIAVAAVNDLAVATGGATSIESGEQYTFQSTDFGYSDVEGDFIQSINIEGLSLAGGSLVLSNGNVPVTEGMTIAVADISTLVFTPLGNSSENASIQYSVNDSDSGSVVAEMLIRVEAITKPGDMETDDPDAVEEEVEEEVEDEAEEETDEEESETTSTTETIVGTTPAPVVAKPPVLAPVAEVAEEAPVAAVEEIGDIEERILPPVRQTQVDPPKDSYQPIPLPNHTFEPVSRRAMLEEIDQSSQDVREYGEFLGTDVAKVSFTFGSILSIGGVSWLLRGGALMAAFLSAMPAWSRFDPVTIVTSRRDENEEEESSEFDVMMAQVKDARSRVKGIS